MFRFSPELKQLRYEEIFRLSVTVTDKQALTFLYFTVYGNSVMTCIKNVVGFYTSENYNLISMNYKMYYFLQIAAEIQANPYIFLTVHRVN
jgi:hypothetical protein